MSLDEPVTKKAKTTSQSGWARLPDSDIAASVRNAVVLDFSGAASAFDGVPGSSLIVGTSDGVGWSSGASNLPYSEFAAGAIHDNTLYISNGNPHVPRWLAEVWAWDSSQSRWIPKTTDALYRARWTHSLASFNGKLWVLGGMTPQWRYLGDTWTSSDNGATWIQDAAPGFPARGWAASVVFGGKLWLLGGKRDPDVYFADAWVNADDGRGWQPKSVDWPARFSARAHVIDGVLYVVGGRGPNAKNYRDVWATADGDHWTLLDDQAPWGVFDGQGSTGIQSAITVFGGAQGAMVARYTPPPPAG